MKLLSMDLELNKNLDTNQGGRVTDIIQIGAVVLNMENGEIEDKFNRYIKLSTPMDNGELRLSHFIVKLTGIKNETLETEGVELTKAVEDLYDFCHKLGLHRCGIEWGADDFSHLQRQFLEKGGGSDKWYFARSHFNAKKLYQAKRIIDGQKAASGLSKSMNKLGLSFEGRKHNALDDAYNTARIFWELASRLKEEESVREIK